MTRLRHLTALGVLVVLLAWPGISDAATYETHGWWWRAQTGLAGAALPPPPDVPEGGLLVEQAPDGATAVAALRFELGDDETDPALELTVASGESTGAVVAACPTRRTGWSGEQAGRWDAAPGWDCEQGRVDGIASEDGTTWTWPLAPLVRDGGVISVALVGAASTPFHLAFEAPTDAALSTTMPPPSPPRAAPSSLPPPLSEPSSAGGFRSPPPPPQAPPPTASSSDMPVSAPPAVQEGSDAPVDSGPPPQVAPPAQPEPPAVPTAIAPPAATQPEDLPPLAFLLMGAIGALILMDVIGHGLPWHGPPQSTGGIGRFATTRTQRPSPLW